MHCWCPSPNVLWNQVIKNPILIGLAHLEIFKFVPPFGKKNAQHNVLICRLKFSNLYLGQGKHHVHRQFLPYAYCTTTHLDLQTLMAFWELVSNFACSIQALHGKKPMNCYSKEYGNEVLLLSLWVCSIRLKCVRAF